MKRFFVGLWIGWITVPVVMASFSVATSDRPVNGTERYNSPCSDSDDLRDSHAYKWYLTQMLRYMMSMDATLKELNKNMQAVKDKLHA